MNCIKDQHLFRLFEEHSSCFNQNSQMEDDQHDSNVVNCQ